MLGAEVVPVTIGSRTLKDAINEALRDWVANVATTHYCIGSVMGPHPFPMMVRDFQRVIGVEARQQILAQPAAARRRHRLRRRGLERDRRVPRVHRRRRGCPDRLRGRRRRRPHRPARGHRRRRLGRRDPRHADVPAAGQRRPDPAHALDLGRPRLPGRRTRARLAADTGRASTARSPTPRRWTRSAAVPDRGHHPGDRERPRHRRRPGRGPGTVARTPCLVSLSGRGDKDVDTAARWFGLVTGERRRARTARSGEAQGEAP